MVLSFSVWLTTLNVTISWSVLLRKHSGFPLPTLNLFLRPLEARLWKGLGCRSAVIISQGSFLSR